MSKLSYRALDFSVSGWYDQVQIGYVQNDGRLDEDQDGPGFKLFGYDSEEVLVECVCWLSDGESDKRSGDQARKLGHSRVCRCGHCSCDIAMEHPLPHGSLDMDGAQGTMTNFLLCVLIATVAYGIDILSRTAPPSGRRSRDCRSRRVRSDKDLNLSPPSSYTGTPLGMP